tara:strand:+ start:627 stop:1193 length:567 start_codon:yes stop_codon:yes gene_type:complete
MLAYSDSIAIEIPIPPPIHIEARALFPPSLDNMLAALQAILAPEAPNGCPMDKAPPSILTISGFNPSSLMQAILCEENASFNSKTSISLESQPALSSASLVEETGPKPISSGGQPVVAAETTLANGCNSFFLAKSSLHIMEKTAPSVRGEEVAAVTVPPSKKAGPKRDIDSREEFGLIHPSLEIKASL